MNLNNALIALALSTSTQVLAQAAPADSGVFAPGVQHVCVPTDDGEGWDCGTEAAPPENYQAPGAERVKEDIVAGGGLEQSPATEPMISDDETPPPPVFLADPDRLTPYAPIVDEPVVDEPAVAADDAPVANAESPAPAAPQPVVEPAVERPVETEVAPAPVSSATTSEPAPPAIAAAPEAVSPMSALGDAAGFARLPAPAFTLQLAYAPDPSNFAALVAALGLDPAGCYALRVRGTNGAMWLLAHGAFADVAAARTAQSALPAAAGLSAQWPRRIGALQSEIAQAQ
jgi:hypothetical protein